MLAKQIIQTLLEVNESGWGIVAVCNGPVFGRRVSLLKSQGVTVFFPHDAKAQAEAEADRLRAKNSQSIYGPQIGYSVVPVLKTEHGVIEQG